jgi:hypothetical protein
MSISKHDVGSPTVSPHDVGQGIGFLHQINKDAQVQIQIVLLYRLQRANMAVSNGR